MTIRSSEIKSESIRDAIAEVEQIVKPYNIFTADQIEAIASHIIITGEDWTDDERQKKIKICNAILDELQAKGVVNIDVRFVDDIEYFQAQYNYWRPKINVTTIAAGVACNYMVIGDSEETAEILVYIH